MTSKFQSGQNSSDVHTNIPHQGNVEERFHVELKRVNQLFAAGHYIEANRFEQSLVDCAARSESVFNLITALRLAGDVKFAVGEARTARDRYSQSLNLAEWSAGKETVASVCEAFGSVLIELREFDTAHVHLLRALNLYESINNRTGSAMAQRSLGELEMSRKNWKVANEWLSAAKMEATKVQKLDLVHDINALSGVVFAHGGQVSRGWQLVANSLEYWKSRHHPRWVAKCKLQLASVELLRGNSSDAYALALQAKGEYAAIGDAIGQQRSRQIAGACNARKGVPSL